jgi:hypothetical protein
MKSAYELAMERMQKEKPTQKLSEAQLEKLREIDSLYTAKLAERRTFLHDKIQKAAFAGDAETEEVLRRELARDIIVIEEEMEERKQQVRDGGA